MTPEAAAFLDKSRDLLARASALLAGDFPDDAGRAAYLTGFHAAQALIFERIGRSPKTHSGVQSEFAPLTRHEAAVDRSVQVFLGRTYNLKALVDYETGPSSRVTHEQAAEAVSAAERFLSTVEALLATRHP